MKCLGFLVFSLQDEVVSFLSKCTPAVLFEARLAFRVAVLAGLLLPPAALGSDTVSCWGAGRPLTACPPQWDQMLPHDASEAVCPSELHLVAWSDSPLSEYARGRLLACLLRLGLASAGGGAHWLQAQLLDPRTAARHYLLRCAFIFLS